MMAQDTELVRWREKAARCTKEIEQSNYYPELWAKVKHKKPLGAYDKGELLRPFQKLWDSIPDSPAIHVWPFSLICDLAEEYVFGDGEP